MKTAKLLFVAALAFICNACEKPPGPGGRATVKGKVYVMDYDKYATYKIDEYYAPGEKVYIVYGDQNVTGNDVRTKDDGSFEFLYLNKGHYKVFVESRDTSIHMGSVDKTIPLSVEFDITSVREVKDLGKIVICK
jgi:hypothetical protein